MQAFWRTPTPERGTAALLRENPAFASSTTTFMDIEHINQIGNTLADLSARTDALRGYL
jgi:hypothetical protein